MTPSQLLRPAKPEEPPSPPAFTVGLTPPKYTSGAIDEDFSISVDLLMNTPRFLLFLQDADRHFDILSELARTELNDHIDLIQDFTGQWVNEDLES